MPKKEQPWAKCTKCKFFTTDDLLSKCPECGGNIEVNRSSNVWFECQVCDASGVKYGSACRKCSGNGWLFLPGDHSGEY